MVLEYVLIVGYSLLVVMALGETLADGQNDLLVIRTEFFGIGESSQSLFWFLDTDHSLA